MPDLVLKGTHENQAGTSLFSGIRGATSSKGRVATNPPSTGLIDVYFINSGGTTNSRSDVMMGFDTSGITELPSSAVLHLAVSGTQEVNITQAAHQYKLWKTDDSISLGLAQNGFTSAGLAQNATPGFWNDFVGWHATNSWATAGVEFGGFTHAEAVDAAAAADNKLSITLTAAALQEMVDEDVFIFHIVEHSILGLNQTPSSNDRARVTLGVAVGSFTGDFTPFISYEEDLDFPNVENESGALVGGDFTINTFSSAVLGAQFAQTGEQVPFSLGTPGARHLRGRLTAYATEKGEKVSDKEGRGKKGKSKT